MPYVVWDVLIWTDNYSPSPFKVSPLMNGKNTGSERREGIVAEVHPDEVVVRLQQLSACSGCHAKDFCTTADCKDRLIRVQTHGIHYEVGQAVIIEGKDSVGRWAILLAFVLPLFLIPFMLGVGQEGLHWGEWASALLALVALVLYFLILFALTPILSRTLALEVRPLNPSDTY